MRKILIPAVLALVAQPAFAQTATGTVNIDGSVTPRCLFTTDEAVIHLGELALGGTGSTAGRLNASVVNNYPPVTLAGWCNTTSANVTVEAFPITNPTDVSGTGGTFANRVDYTASVSAAAATPSDSTLTDGPDAGTSTDGLGGLYAGNFTVDLSAASAPSNGILVAGDYTGYVEVTLTPNYTPPQNLD